MKKILTVMLSALILASCSSEPVENRETRSTVYRGQTTWDMYENFGAPNFAIRLSPDETHFIYRREETTRDWTKMYFDWCDMVFVTINDRIVDWNFSGNRCTMNVADEELPPPDDNPRINVLDRYGESADQLWNADPVVEYKDDRVVPTERDTLF